MKNQPVIITLCVTFILTYFQFSICDKNILFKLKEFYFLQQRKQKEKKV